MQHAARLFKLQSEIHAHELQEAVKSLQEEAIIKFVRNDANIVHAGDMDDLLVTLLPYVSLATQDDGEKGEALASVPSTSVLSHRPLAVFWRSMLQAFPELIDFLSDPAMIGSAERAALVRGLHAFYNVCFDDGNHALLGGVYGRKPVHSLVHTQKRPSVAFFLASATRDEVELWCKVLKVLQDEASPHVRRAPPRRFNVLRLASLRNLKPFKT